MRNPSNLLVNLTSLPPLVTQTLPQPLQQLASLDKTPPIPKPRLNQINRLHQTRGLHQKFPIVNPMPIARKFRTLGLNTLVDAKLIEDAGAVGEKTDGGADLGRH